MKIAALQHPDSDTQRDTWGILTEYGAWVRTSSKYGGLGEYKDSDGPMRTPNITDELASFVEVTIVRLENYSKRQKTAVKMYFIGEFDYQVIGDRLYARFDSKEEDAKPQYKWSATTRRKKASDLVDRGVCIVDMLLNDPLWRKAQNYK